MPGDGSAGDSAPPWWGSAVAGPASGLASRLATYPSDTIKARMQIQGTGLTTGRYSGLVSAVSTILRADGPAGLYRGFLPVMGGVLPANAAYFSGYELGKVAVAWADPNSMLPTALRDGVAGVVAQGLSGAVWTPVDLIKERIQVAGFLRADGAAASASPADVVRAALREKGFLGLFRGYWINNSVWFPWGLIYAGSYERCKRSLADALDRTGPEDLPPWAFAFSAAAASAVGAVATHPLDVIKTRIQVLPDAGGSRWRAWGVARRLVQQEGVLGVFDGAVARLWVMAPGSAVGWMVYEMVMRRL
ncbi:unnamed protein product [Pedinophyceae sp. YPF-701]|nr:unnamed protein product [Pedinophyceae sp. YPF-701]